jgi:hypothetical protein
VVHLLPKLADPRAGVDHPYSLAYNTSGLSAIVHPLFCGSPAKTNFRVRGNRVLVGYPEGINLATSKECHLIGHNSRTNRSKGQPGARVSEIAVARKHSLEGETQ